MTEQAPMSDLTYQDVLNILRLVDAAPFSDFEIEFEGTRVKVTRPTGSAPGGAQPATRATPAVAPPAQPANSPVAAAASVTPARHAPAAATDAVEIKPPMAGTFYAAPSPGAAPFVELDHAVRTGDQLGIVEVMKLFTPVLSPCDGIVRAILVGSEQFVESDQTLMIIEAANRAAGHDKRRGNAARFT